MTTIVIHRCSLKVVRRDGWSWGADPNALLRGAIDALPAVIARTLGVEISSRTGAVEISAPIRVSIPVRLRELIGMSGERNVVSGGDNTTHDIALRLVSALKFELVKHGVSDIQHQPHETGKADSEGPSRARRPRTESAIVELLLEWLGHGTLDKRLRAFDLTSLIAWHRALMDFRGHVLKTRADGPPSDLSEIVAEARKPDGLSKLELDEMLRTRIALIVKAIGSSPEGGFPAELRSILETEFPLPDRTVADQAIDDSSGDAKQGAKTKALSRPRDLHAGSVGKTLVEEIQVASALPFLILGPLSRINYFQTFSATLEAAELTARQTTFATALAYKVLAPPERGWLRKAADVKVAGTFAGLADAVDGEELHAFSRAISQQLSPLDATIRDSLIGGHTAGSPFILRRIERDQERELVLIDVEGLFPVVTSSRFEPIIAAISECPASVLLVPSDVADPELLHRLDASGIRFLTDAPPTRRESWRRVGDRSAKRWWTNDRTAPVQTLLTSARPFENNESEAKELIDEIFVNRPVLRAGLGTDLNRHLSLAASIALGTIAWTLWNQREPTNPQLAIQRFGDLEGWVRFGEDEVRVRLPLGRRFIDLKEHRLLDDVTDVPWFDGRVLKFSGG